ncbi:MAG TPA: Smr/MutS family protein, partial [Acidobacteriota bacterium]|nr:Smr/MutS family protein [Acidobacteriota bacterium]
MNWLRRLLGWESKAAEESGAEPVEEADEWEDEDFPEVIEMPVEDFLDLHHFPPKEIPVVVDAYLQEAMEKGFTEVRLIHGRGKGVQRRRVQSLLSRHPLVASFR